MTTALMAPSSSATISARSGSRPRSPTSKPTSTTSKPSIALPGQNRTPSARPRSTPDVFPAGGGATSALSFMINGMLDFGDDDGISGFVGGGVGVARVDFNNVRAFENQGAFVDDSDTRFAWQIVAGVRQAITDNIDVTVALSLLQRRRPPTRSTSAASSPNRGSGRTACWVASPSTSERRRRRRRLRRHRRLRPRRHRRRLRRRRVQPGPYIVFFDWDKDEITPQAAAILDNAAAPYRRLRSGSGRHRRSRRPVGLGRLQRRSVAASCEQRRAATWPVVASRTASITTEAFGESRPLVETADGVREPQNRRVEITYGPGSGW